MQRGKSPGPAQSRQAHMGIAEDARKACKPDSVPGLPPWMTIPLAPPLPAGSSCQPGPLGLKRPCGGILADLPRARPLFGIAPGGACRAVPVARSAVGSCPTVSPLPCMQGGLVLCGAFPGVAPAGRYPAPLLHGVRTFLGTVARPAVIQPSARDAAYAPAGGASTGKRAARVAAMPASVASAGPSAWGRKRRRKARRTRVSSSLA